MRFAKFSASEDGKDLYVNPAQVVFVQPSRGSRNGSQPLRIVASCCAY